MVFDWDFYYGEEVDPFDCDEMEIIAEKESGDTSDEDYDWPF